MSSSLTLDCSVDLVQFVLLCLCFIFNILVLCTCVFCVPLSSLHFTFQISDVNSPLTYNAEWRVDWTAGQQEQCVCVCLCVSKKENNYVSNCMYSKTRSGGWAFCVHICLWVHVCMCRRVCSFVCVGGCVCVCVCVTPATRQKLMRFEGCCGSDGLVFVSVLCLSASCPGLY